MNKFALVVALHVSAALAAAVSPVETLQDSEADFAAGQFRSVTVSSQGELSLGGALEVLMPSSKATAVLSAIASIGPDVYVGDGLAGQVFRVAAGKAELVAKVPGTIVTSLRAQGDRLLVGTGGNNAGLYRLDPRTKQVDTIWTDPKVKYVWAVLPAPNNAFYAATGPEGKVFLVDAAGKAGLIYQAKDIADNIRCLAMDKGKLYAGTDKSGLVILIDPAAKTGRVLLDANEPEITALAIGAGGEVYAATAAGTAEAPKPLAAAASGPARSAASKGAPSPHPKTTQPATATAPATASAPAPAPATVSAPAPAPATTSAPASMAARPPEAAGPAAPAAPPAGDGTGDVVTQDPALAKDAAAGPPAPPVSGPGNAVYCIRPDGLVRTVVRRPMSFLCLALRGDELILGTGNDGKVYAVSTAGDRAVMLADLDAKRVTALLVAADGGLLFTTANGGAVCSLSGVPAKSGTFTAKAIDAGQVARWGALQIDADSAAPANLTVATRTGNIQTPDEKTWSPWTPPAPLTGRFHKVASPAGRFMQYRLELTPAAGGARPLVRSVSAVSQVGNLPPVILAAAVSPSASPDDTDREAIKAAGRKVYRVIRLQAGDPNNDVLQYRFDYRAVGTDRWVELTKDKDSPVPMFGWNTLMVADGAYEIRITANDKASNPPDQALATSYAGLRTVVDHTPPAITRLAARIEGHTVAVTGSARDALSRLTSIYYSLNSQEPWIPVQAADGICDDQAEDFAFTLKDLPGGPQQITVRVRDAYGNVAYQTIPVTVEK